MKKLVRALCILVAPMAVAAQGLPTKAPAPELNNATVSWCYSRSNSYCTFAWNKQTGCCYATYTQPGASCPTICI